MNLVRRLPWWLLAGVVLVGGVTVALASSLTLSSANLTVYRTCVVTGYPTTSTAAIESQVNQASTGTNYGAATTMNVQSQNTSRNMRSYVKLDLAKCSPAIPATATIRVATLRLLANSVPAGLCRTHDVFRVTANWTEAGVTWAAQPTVSGARTSFTTVGASPCTVTAGNTYVNWNVTADVATFVAGTATNFGWQVRDDVESFSATAYTAVYVTEEAGVLGGAPQLVVNYS